MFDSNLNHIFNQSIDINDINVLEGNIYCKKLKTYIKDNFVRIGNFLYKYLIHFADEIIETKQIPITIITDDKYFNIYLRYNNVRTETIDNIKYISFEHTQKIIDILIKYKESLSKPKIGTNSYDYKYIKTDPIDYELLSEEDKKYTDNIMPNSDTEYIDILQNLFINNDINFVFNSKIDKVIDVRDGLSLKSGTFKITSAGEDVDLATKYRWECKHPTNYGECGNIVEFFEGHKHNTIKCNMSANGSNPEEGHALKNIDSIPPSEFRRLYCYYIKQLGDDDTEYLAYSFKPINKEIFECNYIYTCDKQPYILILGHIYNSKHEIVLDNEQLISKTNDFFVEDLFQSIQEYYKKYHKLNLTNQNKIVSYVNIIQCVCKILLNRRYHSLIVGESGSGKTWIANHIFPMFTNSYKNVLGTSITKNRFLGGRSNQISMFKNSLYSKGLVETKDFLVIDEATEPLDMIANPKVINNSDNLFAWIKAIDSEIDRAIQGSQSTKPNAVLCCFGNLENLRFIRSELLSKIRKKYTNFSAGKTYNNNYPLYKQPEWYAKVMNNELLAKAHAYVRETDYNTINYVTGLPTAEMSRYAFFIVLEDEDKGFTKRSFIGEDKEEYQLHREIFIQNLKDIFKINTEYLPEPDMKFKKDVWDWFNDYIQNHRNNFRPNTKRDINNHIFKKMVNMCTDLIYLNNLFYDKEMIFRDSDKLLLEGFLSFNYNTLDKQEASMSTRPKTNDLLFDLNELEDYNKESIENYKSILLKKEFEGSIDIDENNISEDEKKVIDEFNLPDEERKVIDDIFGDVIDL